MWWLKIAHVREIDTDIVSMMKVGYETHTPSPPLVAGSEDKYSPTPV